MTIKLRGWLLMLLLPVLPACYPKGADYIEELDIVVTNFSSDYNFAAAKTYAMPDSVIKITGEAFTDPDGDGKPQFVGSDYSAAILGAIKQNMTAYGWTQVNKNANPDVVLLPSSMTTTNIYYYYDWWYWDWWYGGWYGWGWYYPGYYPPYVTGYRSGSVLINMVDSKAASGGTVENIPVLWTAIFNGLAEGSNITARIQTNITKAFTQSPYLKH
jgi:hypothetical protein